jgi:hypothetical protein
MKSIKAMISAMLLVALTIIVATQSSSFGMRLALFLPGYHSWYVTSAGYVEHVMPNDRKRLCFDASSSSSKS